MIGPKLRKAAEGLSEASVGFFLPDGRLDSRRSRALWRTPHLGFATAPLDRIGLAVAEAAAKAMEARHGAGSADRTSDGEVAGTRPYAVIGDSHSLQLVRRGKHRQHWLRPFHWLCRAASARGLLNSGGRSGAAEVVGRALTALDANSMPILFKFGQVDIEFVYAFKRIKAGFERLDEDHYAAFVDETAERYLAALDRLVPHRMRRRAVIASVFPPALSDDAWRRGYVNGAVVQQHSDQSQAELSTAVARLEIPGLAVRTRMHARFNAKIEAATGNLGMTYLDCFGPLLGQDGLLDVRYRGRRDGADHHLAFRAARKPIIGRLWAVVDGEADV